MLQALPGLTVGLQQGPTFSCPGACLLPVTIYMSSMEPRLFVWRGACRFVWRGDLSPVLVSAQSPEGTEAAGDCLVRASLSMHTPSWVMTASGVGFNFALKSERLLGAGRVQVAEGGTLKPAGAGGIPGPPRAQECPCLQLGLGGCSCAWKCGAAAPPAWKWAGLPPFPCSSWLGQAAPVTPPPAKPGSWRRLLQAGCGCHQRELDWRCEQDNWMFWFSGCLHGWEPTLTAECGVLETVSQTQKQRTDRRLRFEQWSCVGN